MTLHLWLVNLAAYSAQIAIVVAAGAALPRLTGLRRPDALLFYRQALLAACLLLPFAQPWRRPAPESSIDISIRSLTTVDMQAPQSRRPSLEQVAAVLLAAGVLARLGWLLAGLSRLRRRRRQGQALDPLPTCFETLSARLGVSPTLRLSADVSGPVTFGISSPVILLPGQFLRMPAAAQEAIVCHELVHIRRRDWAFTMAEECIRALFWFHPAIWWLLGKIHLTREQAVDREVIAITASREQYIDALLAVAEGGLRPDLAPAPLFLQRSHLSQRVALLLKEVSMSQRRLLSSLAAVTGALILTARLAVISFPINAPAQEVVQGGANLLHRAPIEYPADAVAKGIQGTVIVEAAVNDRGVVTDARVLSGPELLRKAALRSVLEWHYSTQAQSPMHVAIDFKLPSRVNSVPAGSMIEPGVVSTVRFLGIPSGTAIPAAPILKGDLLDASSLSRLRQTVREIDEHLEVRADQVSKDGAKSYALTIFYAAPVENPMLQPGPERIRVGGNVQANNILNKVQPVYPPVAKQAGLQGVVRLNVVINKEGTVQDIQVASGHPLLAETSVDAVRQWTYRPTLLNGALVEVVTVVDVNFTLKD
jgi:TonB family protein